MEENSANNRSAEASRYMTEMDPMLRRVERTAAVACLVMAVLAWPLGHRGAAAPLGVVGGGLLVFVSYRGIKSGVDAVASAMTVGESGRAKAALGLVKFFTRFAILGAAAYVIIARLRLPPVAVCAGASSFVVAVAVEAVRHRGGST